MSRIKVLYEDNHIIAVYKPSGVLSQADKTGDLSLMDLVKKYLKEKYKKPGNVFLGMVQRLDRPASGIVLFGKTSKGASRLSEQFRNRTILKIYHAVVLGKPRENKGELISYLAKDRKLLKSEISADRNIANSVLYYEVIKSNDKYSLLKIQLGTGRFHQIRAQLASIGCPIIGDRKYGAKTALADKSICLCATSVSFRLAIEDKIKNISIEIPKEWQKYFN